MTVDTHTLPKKLQDDELVEIRERWASMSPRDAVETSPQDAWLLLSHVQWLNDRLERVMEERDAHRDRATRALGRIRDLESSKRSLHSEMRTRASGE